MNILMILVKNTAALDYSIPLLWKIKQAYPEIKVSILYCALNRQALLKEAGFYSKVLAASEIREYDFSDFASGGEINFEQILPRLNPDIILLDKTTSTKFEDCGFIIEYLAQIKRKVVFLPHAPHHAKRVAFPSFLYKIEDKVTDYEFWASFKYEESWRAAPEKKSQFFYIGYPGLDAEWLEQCTTGFGFRPVVSKNTLKEKENLKCLFVIRRFLDKGQPRSPGDDAFVYDYEEFSYYLSLVSKAVEKTNLDIEIIVKPHPSNNYQAVEKAFREAKIPKWQISCEPIYALLPDIDFVISLYSTVFFIPAMLGIPVIILNSSTQTVVHNWDKMAQLYTGFQFYLDNPADLPARLAEVVDLALHRRSSSTKSAHDIEHLRDFYPDGAIDRALVRLGLGQPVTETTNVTDFTRLGNTYLAQQHYQQALDSFMQAVQADPTVVEAWVGLAQIAAIVEQPDFLAKTVEMIRFLAPNHPRLPEFTMQVKQP